MVKKKFQSKYYNQNMVAALAGSKNQNSQDNIQKSRQLTSVVEEPVNVNYETLEKIISDSQNLNSKSNKFGTSND
jgi:hypothetical protein